MSDLRNPPDLEARPSKSELKRRAEARQKLVEALLEIADGDLRQVDLSPSTLAELGEIRPMRLSQARKRAIKHLANQLSENELGAAQNYLVDRKGRQLAQTHRLHAVERWRERLIDEGDLALEELCGQHPALDRQHLRTLIRSAQKERQLGKSAANARKLFRELRELLG